jgi:hypothetical protein
MFAEVCYESKAASPLRAACQLPPAADIPELVRSPHRVRGAIHRNVANALEKAHRRAPVQGLTIPQPDATNYPPARHRTPGDNHPGMMGDIISERWAELSRNGWAVSVRNHGRLAPESAKCALGQEPTGNYRAIRGLQRIWGAARVHLQSRQRSVGSGQRVTGTALRPTLHPTVLFDPRST